MSAKKPNYIWTTPATHFMVVGEAFLQTIEFDGSGTLVFTDTKSYRSGADQSTACVAGSGSITDRMLTGKTFTPDQKGTYILVHSLTDGGIARISKTKVIVARAEAE